MKKLFGQKPKITKTSSQPNAASTDQFTRPIPSRDDHWVVVQDQASVGSPPLLQDRSRSGSLASLPPAVAAFTPSPGSNTNNTASYQQQPNPYGSNGHQSSQSLLQPNHNQVLKRKQPQGVHGAAAILRSLDPEQTNLGRSASPTLESAAHEPSEESLPSTVETERDPRLAEREYELERERERHREREIVRDRRREQEIQRERGREHERERDQDRGRERDRDRDRPKDKEKKKGLFSSGRDRDRERERSGQAELTRMMGYLTATASEDWSLVLEVCERASASESSARDASKALRREFKYAEPGAQLSAARLWAIMLRNCSDVFITQASGKKFLDTIEEVLLSGSTSPVVRERLLDVLAAAAFTHPGHGKESYRTLWKKVKPPNKPEEGIPFDEDDAMLNPSPAPVPNSHGRNLSHGQSVQQHVISADEDIRRLFEECEIGRGNAALLNQALTFARPNDLSGPGISEWYRKCRGSQDFIMAQIPWATAQADRSREQLRRMYLDENGQETRPIPTSKEEELLAALLGANQELLEAFRIYDDLERLGIAEQEEREVEERSRKETRLDRTQIQFIGTDGSFQMEEPGGSNNTGAGGSAGPSRSPSPAPSFSNLPPVPTQRPPSHASNTHNHSPSPHPGLAPPPPAPQGPRQAHPRSRSRTPSPDAPALPPALVPQHGHTGSLGVDIKRLARMSFESVQDLVDRATDEQTPIVPSAKAMGKRKLVVEGNVDSEDPPHSTDEFLDGRISPFGGDESVENEDEESREDRWKKPITFAYDAAAERSKEMRRGLGIPAPMTNGRTR